MTEQYPEEERGAEDLEGRVKRLEATMDGEGNDSEGSRQDWGDGKDGCGCSIPFNLAFLLVGGIVFMMCTGWPVLHWIDAHSWADVECEIVHSGYVMEYRYVWEGQEYVSQQYDFSSGYTHASASEYGAYKKGQTARCFVNPDDPEEAVLSKAFSTSYFRGVVGLPFALFGFAMMWRTFAPGLSRLGRWSIGTSPPE